MTAKIGQIIYWYSKSEKVILTGKVEKVSFDTYLVKTFQGRTSVIKDYEACKTREDAYGRQLLFES